MAFTSASDLLDAVKSQVKDDDLTDAILNDQITLAESELNRALPVNAFRQWETLTATADSRVLTPSEEFVEPIALFLTTYGTYDRLTPIVDGVLNYQDSGAAPPQAWTVVGNGSTKLIHLDFKADQAHTFEFYRRIRGFDLLNTDPNWVLTNHPDIYFTLTCAFAYRFKENWQQFKEWKAYGIELARQVKMEEDKLAARAHVVPEFHTGRSGSFNINAG